jgi:hypothetical protein
MKPPRRPWLIILNVFGLSHKRDPLIHRCIMRSIPALLACVSLFAASAASADSRVFIIANQADGYGVDQCLAKGENVAPTPPGPTASRAISPRRCPTGASTPTKSPDRFRPEPTATMPAATNTSRSPANARAVRRGRPAPPHPRPGNDVTLPREAGMGSRVGRADWLSCRAESLSMAGYA